MGLILCVFQRKNDNDDFTPVGQQAEERRTSRTIAVGIPDLIVAPPSPIRLQQPQEPQPTHSPPGNNTLRQICLDIIYYYHREYNCLLDWTVFLLFLCAMSMAFKRVSPIVNDSKIDIQMKPALISDSLQDNMKIFVNGESEKYHVTGTVPNAFDSKMNLIENNLIGNKKLKHLPNSISNTMEELGHLSSCRKKSLVDIIAGILGNRRSIENRKNNLEQSLLDISLYEQINAESDTKILNSIDLMATVNGSPHGYLIT